MKVLPFGEILLFGNYIPIKTNGWVFLDEWAKIGAFEWPEGVIFFTVLFYTENLEHIDYDYRIYIYQNIWITIIEIIFIKYLALYFAKLLLITTTSLKTIQSLKRVL